MNTIRRSHKLLGSLLFALCLLASPASSAHGGGGGFHGGGFHGGGFHGAGFHGGWHHGGGWGYPGIIVGPGFYGNPYYYSNCGWVGGHWRHGYWIPAHRVCWY